MLSFKNFANGSNDEFSQESTSVRYKQTRDARVGSRIEKVWATDFEKCESREDYENYISKYGKYDSNKYISQARAKIESIDAEESARIERENAARRVQNTPAVPSYNSGNNENNHKSNIFNACMKAFVWAIIVVAVGGFSYYQYLQKQKEETTSVIVVQPTKPQNTQGDNNQHATHTHSEQISEQENTVVETEAQHETQYMSCMVCGQSGRCGVCFGLGRCGGCGGSGQIYSVFYGDEVGPGRLTDCGACGGSGACGACGGSGLCQACNGRGQVELEY